MTPSSPSTYRDMLRSALAARIRKNPNYSLRAFARDLSLRPSHLSLVLNEKNGISPVAARRVAQELGLNVGEREFFCDSVLSLHSRNDTLREAARARLKKRQIRRKYQVLDHDRFAVISDWHHYAILELLDVEGLDKSPESIASALGLTKRVAVESINRLIRVGLLKRVSGRLVCSNEFSTTQSDVPSEAAVKYHEQMLGLAQKALREQPQGEREFYSMMMSIQRNQIPLAKKEIRRFIFELNQKLSSTSKKDGVYNLSVQFFDILRPLATEGGPRVSK